MNVRRLALAVVALLLVASTAAAAPPVITCPAPLETYETAQLQTAITAFDPDGDPVTLRCLNPPFRASFDPPTGIFSWVPYYTQAGVYDIQFQAIAGGETTGCSYHITVDNFDRAPVPNCLAPQTFSYTSIANLQFTATDPDKDSLTWSSPKLPAGATLSRSGAFRWDTSKVNIGTYTMEIDVSDGTFVVPCSLVATLAPVFSPPIITCPQLVTLPELSTTQFTLTVVSPAGLGTAVSVQGMPLHATFDPSTNIFTWTPQPGQAGSYLVTFVAVDGADRRSSCTTQINVGATNVLPPTFTACPGPVSSRELSSISLQFTATDSQNLQLSYGATGLPAGATLDGTTGAFHWSPTVGQAGSYDVTVLASNGSKTANCSVHFTIAAVVPPQFTNCQATRSGTELQNLQFQMLATDGNGFGLTLSATGVPAGATFNVTTGTFSWTPAIGQAGAYSVTFKATSLAGVATCPVQLNIGPASPGQPTIQCPGALQGAETALVTFTITASDPQNRALVLALTNPPTGATFASNGLFTWRPTLNQGGAYTLHFTVTNGFLANACDVPLTIAQRANTPPRVACPIGFTTTANRTVQFAVPAIDAEGDAVTYLSRNLPPGATYAAGQFTWAPTDASVGTWLPEFIATDSELRDSCKVALEVVAHPGGVQPLEPVLAHVKDVRPDQGGWVRVTLVAAPSDVSTSPGVTAYGLWRRIEGPDAHALAPPPAGAAPSSAVGSVVTGTAATSLGFPAGTWESVAYTPALQAFDLNILAPTRDDSSTAGRPFEVFVATAHTANPAVWSVSMPDSGYSVDDLPPRAPGALAAQTVTGGTRLAWASSPDADLDRYTIFRGANADFALVDATVLGDTHDSVFVDTAPVADAWYRVEAIDVHGNGAVTAAVAGPGAPAWGAHGVALSAPRPNPSRGETAFDLVLPVAGEDHVEIVDVRGARVRTLVSGALAAGRTTLAWDGRDESGRRAPSGLYHVRVRAAGIELTRKLVLLR
jgi:hypothetical protein